jgi:hypothetical protein
VYGYYAFPKPSVHGFPTAADPAIAAAGTSFSPLPCHARDGYGVTSAHRVEVEVGADGHANAPPSGATAAAPPAAARRALTFLASHVRNLMAGLTRHFGLLATLSAT